jgi:hypothetical protein
MPNSFFCRTRTGLPSRTEPCSTFPNAELGHHGEYCSFDAIIERYHLDKDAALVELAKIVRAAGTPKRDWAAEGIGLEAIANGFRRISSDDFDNMRRQFGVYDALYAHCQAQVARSR